MQSADMIDMAMGGDDIPDLCRLQSMGSNIPFYLIVSVSHAGIYQDQTALCIDKIDICILRRERSVPTA